MAQRVPRSAVITLSQRRSTAHLPRKVRATFAWPNVRWPRCSGRVLWPILALSTNWGRGLQTLLGVL